MNSLSRFLRKFENDNFLRLFMPGHQGKCSFLNNNISLKLDLTEINGADNLYAPEGIIKSLEEKISSLFSSNCFVSASGSTLCIQTILWLLKNRKFVVLRGAHFSFFNAAAILSISFKLIGNFKDVNFLEVKKALLAFGKGSVLFVTSPNYYGESLNIKKFREICNETGTILVVDAAHGAHFGFLKNFKHPISLGADFCCSSFHKTLPALTGAAILLMKDGFFKRSEVKHAMAIFGSSSPSYLIMDSIGLCADWLEKHAAQEFLKLEQRKEKLIKKFNLVFKKTDPSKLVLDCFFVCGGVFSVVETLKKHKIVPEFYNFRFVVFVLTPFLEEEDWKRLEFFLKELKPQKNKSEEKQFYECFNFKRAVSLKDAVSLKSEEIAIEKANSRVFADLLFWEIPGVLLLTYGEIITKKAITYFEKKGVKKVRVLTEN